ncbi:MAG TPA: hypothetical protein VGM32_15030 [Rhodopila sp.]
MRPHLVLRQVRQAEPGKGCVEDQVRAIEYKLSLDSHLQLAHVRAL